MASLIRHRARTALAIAGIAVAAAMLLDMVMLATGMSSSFSKLLLSRGYNIRIAPKGTLPFDTDLTVPGVTAITATLKSNRDIGRVSPVLGAAIHIPRSGKAVAATALGVHPDVQGDYEFLEGSDLRAVDAMLANDALLHSMQARVGDTVDVATGYDPQLRSFTGSRRLAITGTARFLYGAANQPVAAIRLETLQAMGGKERHDRASFFMIQTRTDADAERVRKWIDATVPGVSAISIAAALGQVEERLSYFRQLAFILGAVSLFVGFLLVTTLVTISVSERTGEIAVMRAIGVSRLHVVEQILLEGMAVSLSGALLGTLLGLVTARYLNSILSGFPGLPTAIDFFLFQPRDAWTALALLIATGILAGMYPAWRAASLPIATSLRRDAIA